MGVVPPCNLLLEEKIHTFARVNLYVKKLKHY